MPFIDKKNLNNEVGNGLGKRLGHGRQPRGFGLGAGGKCVCPKCGAKIPHRAGFPCYLEKCPKCGGLMTRQR